jgi:hypothetical protein
MAITARLTLPRRVSRFFFVLRATPLDSAEIARLSEWLDTPQLILFQRMQPADQRHCVQVFEVLRRDGWDDRDLMQAALLHDCGKAVGGLSVWHRVLIDVGNERWPRLLRWLSHRGPRWLREPLVVGLDHDAIGAEAARFAGCSKHTAALIRRSRDRSIAAQALALRLADDAL